MTLDRDLRSSGINVQQKQQHRRKRMGENSKRETLHLENLSHSRSVNLSLVFYLRTRGTTVVSLEARFAFVGPPCPGHILEFLPSPQHRGTWAVTQQYGVENLQTWRKHSYALLLLPRHSSEEIDFRKRKTLSSQQPGRGGKPPDLAKTQLRPFLAAPTFQRGKRLQKRKT